MLINKSYSREVDLKSSVPKGSAARVNVFNLYCSTLSEIIPDNLRLSGFANDHSVRCKFKANERNQEQQCIKEVEDCMLNIRKWIDAVWLKMNPSKTEFIYLGSRIQLQKYTFNQLNLNGDLIERTDVIRYFGAWLDREVTYKSHINKKYQTAMCNFQRIKCIRHLLDDHSCASLCVSLCMSHLDYANSLLYGLPEVSINKLQRIQSMCAKLTLRKGKCDSPTECMKALHWLPLRNRIHEAFHCCRFSRNT